jgi:hypothetical protein
MYGSIVEQYLVVRDNNLLHASRDPHIALGAAGIGGGRGCGGGSGGRGAGGGGGGHVGGGVLSVLEEPWAADKERATASQHPVIEDRY